MISENEVILNQIQSYDDFFGLNWNQTILMKISYDNEFFKNKNVESVLNMFLFESFDDEECYLDEKHEFLDEEYLYKHPQLVKELIEDYEIYY